MHHIIKYVATGKHLRSITAPATQGSDDGESFLCGHGGIHATWAPTIMVSLPARLGS